MTKFLDGNGLVQLVSGLKDYIETRFDNVFKRRILEANNPVGTVREFSVPTNPATLLGIGTWSQIAQGRTLVGVNTSDPDFNYAGRTGGEKTHKLTVGELPKHQLTVNLKYETTTAAAGTGINWALCEPRWASNPDFKTSSIGDDQPHNNLQPYYCVYVWRRIA